MRVPKLHFLLGPLRLRLVAFALICSLPVITLIVVQRNADTERIRGDAAARATRLAEQLRGNALGKVRAVQGIAHVTTALDFARPGSTSTCSESLAQAANAATADVLNFSVLSPEGQLRCSAIAATSNLNFADRPYFRKAVSTGTVQVSDYTFGRVTKAPAVQLAVPRWDEHGRVVAVGVAAIRPWALLADMLPQPAAEVTLAVFDRNGRLLARYPESETLKPGQVVDGVLSRLQANEGRTLRATGPDGIVRDLSAHAVRVSGEVALWVMAGVDVGPAEAAAHASRTVTTAVVLIVLALVAAIAVLGTSPLVLVRTRALVAAAKRVRGGDLDARVPIGVQDELSPVEREFNAMVESLAAYRDEAGRRQAQARLELEQLVAARTHQLELAIADLRSFSSSISHDLKAPIHTIAGFVQALEERPMPWGDKERHYLARIRAASRHSEELVEGLLSLSHISGRKLQGERVDVVQLIRESLLALGADHVTLVAPAAAMVHGDRTLLKILVENLVANAVKFTGRVTHPTVIFTRAIEGGEEVFSLRDNGAGFDERYADRLFRPFHRLHTVAEFPGTGLGLATAQKVVARHGGRIWARSRPNEGATISFTLWTEHASALEPMDFKPSGPPQQDGVAENAAEAL